MDLFGYFAMAWTLVYLGVRYAGQRLDRPVPAAAAASRPAVAGGTVLSAGGEPVAGEPFEARPAVRRRLPVWPALVLGAVGALAGTAWILRRRTTS